MSAEEPGYVPPDHKTTAEFAIPKKLSPPVDENTVIDPPVTDDTVADFEEPTEDRSQVTVEEARSVIFAKPAPATLQDEPVEPAVPAYVEPVTAQDDAYVEPVTAQDAPTPPVPDAGMDVVAAFAATPPVPREPATAPEVASPMPPVPSQDTQMVPHRGAAVQPALAERWASREAGSQGDPDRTNEVAQPLAAALGLPPAPPHEVPVYTPAPPPRQGRSKLVVLLAVAVGGILLLAGVAAAAFWPDGGAKKNAGAKSSSPAASSSPAPSSSAGEAVPPTSGAGSGTPPDSTAPPASPGAPAVPSPGDGSTGTGDGSTGTGAPSSPGPVVTGKGMTYQIVQQDAGYFEANVVITNKGTKPLTTWSLTFGAPLNVNVKSVWGGKLVHGGTKVEIRNLDGAAPIPPGATFEVKYGAEGIPVHPRSCRFNTRPCGF